MLVPWCVNEEAMPVFAKAAINEDSLLLTNTKNNTKNKTIKILTSWKFGEPSRIIFRTSKICHTRPLPAETHTELLPDVTTCECSTRDSQFNSKTSNFKIFVFNLNYITKCTTCTPVQPSQLIGNWCNVVEHRSSLGWH